MGIKGLHYYVDNKCPEVCRTVSIKELADEIRMPNCEPVLVVDGMSLMHKLYEKQLDWICGGQWYQFVHILINFVQRFRNIGVKLVLFFDGTVCTTKRKEWVSRRVKKYKDIAFIFKYVKQTHLCPEDRFFQLPAAMGSLTRHVFKFCCGVEVYSTTKEADQEIAEYAKSNTNVFAIMSQDSDFFIYNTKPYLSTGQLNLNTMTTILYDRNVLARHLNLHLEQLPLFSSLLGNDIISREMLEPFHRRLFPHSGRNAPPVVDLLPCVIKLIKARGWWGSFNNMRELYDICEHVFRNSSMHNILCESLRVYSLQLGETPLEQCGFLSPHLSRILLDRHNFCVNPPVLFNVLYNLVYDSSEVVEDCSDRSLPPAALIFRPVRQHTYGLLFGKCMAGSVQSARSSEVCVKEWCAYAGNMLRTPDYVKPLPLNFSGYVPTVEDLWRGGSENQELRVDCFIGCMGLNMSRGMLCSVPLQFVALCSVVHYLLVFNPPLLAPWEVAAFIAQAVSPKARNLEQLSLIQLPHLEPRAIHLASVFMRGLATVTFLLSACAYPFPLEEAMPWRCFDGKLFHEMYIAAKNGATADEMLYDSDEAVGLFSRLLKVIVAGTHLSDLRTYRTYR